MRNAILKIKIKPTKKLNEIYEMLSEKKREKKDRKFEERK
jgi:hypothetical protein